jgi:hypothetical protein
MTYSLLFDIPPDPVVGISAVVAVIIFVLAFVAVMALALAILLVLRKRRKVNNDFAAGAQPSSPSQ